MIKVLKFGGTSVGSTEAMQRTASIIMRDPVQKAVVVSAMSGVTNKLLAMMKEGESKVANELAGLTERHLGTARALLPDKLYQEYEPVLLGRMEGLSRTIREYHLAPRGHEKRVYHDAIASWGERLSTLTLAYVIRARSGSAQALTSEEAGIVATGLPGNGSADLNQTSLNLKTHVLPLVKRDIIPIITGYYGCDEGGRPLTFGRGGSDYSASVVANGLDADALEIWTDVDGFMTADPRIVPSARTLDEMDYNEAAELAYLGAKVLHPRTIEPARKKDLEVWVKNSFHPEHRGTRIHRMHAEDGRMLRSVAMKKDLSIVKVYSGEIVYQPGLVTKILDVIGANGVSTYAVSTSLSTLAVIIPAEHVAEVLGRLQELRDEVEKIDVKNDISLICTVGDGMLGTCGVSAKIFATVADAGANVELISEGASDVALNFAVCNAKAVAVVRLLHERYIEKH